MANGEWPAFIFIQQHYGNFSISLRIFQLENKQRSLLQLPFANPKYPEQKKKARVYKKWMISSGYMSTNLKTIKVSPQKPKATKRQPTIENRESRSQQVKLKHCTDTNWWWSVLRVLRDFLFDSLWLHRGHGEYVNCLALWSMWLDGQMHWDALLDDLQWFSLSIYMESSGIIYSVWQMRMVDNYWVLLIDTFYEYWFLSLW